MSRLLRSASHHQLAAIMLIRLPCLGILSLFAGILLCTGVQKLSGQETLVNPSLRASLLIDAKMLQKQLGSPESSVLDVREKAAYSKAHIPGSVWVDINAWRSKGSEKLGLKDSAFWSQQLGQLGIDSKRHIVVVGDVVTESARCWWLLKYLGMQQVQLLDGGFNTWTAAGFEATDKAPTVKATQPQIEFQSNRLAELSDLLPEARSASQCQVVDNRSEEEFTGKRQVGARAGHVLSATHLEWKHFVDASGKFLSDEALRKLISDHKIDLAKPAIMHCQTGGRSSVGALVLEMLGGKEVRNYYAGWSEYSGQLDAPIEK